MRWPEQAQGGWVLGVGFDLVDVARIEQAVERQGENFIRRVFTEQERQYCGRMKRPGPHWAARFAAKEAVAKALGTGIGGDFGWLTCGVVAGESGEPLAQLDEAGRRLLEKRGVAGIALSLTHTAGLAGAVAVLLGEPPGWQRPAELPTPWA